MWRSKSNEKEYTVRIELDTPRGTIKGTLIPIRHYNKKWIFHKERNIFCQYYRKENGFYYIKINRNIYRIVVDDEDHMSVLLFNELDKGRHKIRIYPKRVYIDPRYDKELIEED